MVNWLSTPANRWYERYIYHITAMHANITDNRQKFNNPATTTERLNTLSNLDEVQSITNILLDKISDGMYWFIPEQHHKVVQFEENLSDKIKYVSN